MPYQTVSTLVGGSARWCSREATHSNLSQRPVTKLLVSRHVTQGNKRRQHIPFLDRWYLARGLIICGCSTAPQVSSTPGTLNAPMLLTHE
jgi:hypothetical protein